MTKLLSWGANSSGQLGDKITCEQITLPNLVDLPERLNLNKVKSVSGGGGHSVIVVEGELYVCGNNDKEQLGLKLHSKSVLTFRLNDLLLGIRISEVSCGWDFTLAVSEQNIVYGWGSNSFGQLGFDSKQVKIVEFPTKIECEPSLSVSAGLRHSVVITTTYKLLVCGYAKKGQLGLLANDSVLKKFSPVPDIPPVTKVCCGQNFTLALTEESKVIATGENNFGQLGIEPGVLSLTKTFIEVIIPTVEGLKDIYCGWTHAFVQTESGKLIGWGRNSYGQVGVPCHTTCLPTILDLPKIKQLSCGSEHNIVVTEDNKIYTWGWNEHGNCGDGTLDNKLKPSEILSHCKIDPILVGSGAGYSFLLTS